jgi:multiple sugar transport system substrate-binding protein
MKLSRRDFLKASVLTGAGALMAACAQPAPAPQPAAPQGAAKAPEPTKAPAPAAPATITYLVRTDIQPTIIKWGEATVEDFQKLNPNIKVEMVGVPWGDYNAKMLAMYAAGTPPEVSANYAAGFATFYANKAISPLNDYVKAENADLNLLEKAAVDSVTRDGQLWALPLAHMPVVIYYNKDILDAAGVKPPPADWSDKSWTYDALLQTATKSTKDLADLKKAQWGVAFLEYHLGTLGAWAYGVDPFNNKGGPQMSDAYKTGKPTDCFFDQPKIVEFMQWMIDLTHKHKVAPRPSDTDAMNQAVGWSYLSGRIGMTNEGVWRLGDIIKTNPAFKWGVGALPYGPVGMNTAPLFNDSWMLGAKCKQPQAGFKFLKYLTLENGAKLYAEQVGFFPAKKDLYNAFFDSIMKVPNIAMTRDDLVKAITGGFGGGFPTPGKTIDRFPEFNTAWNQTTAPMKNGEATVPDGMKAVQAKFKSLIGA